MPLCPCLYSCLLQGFVISASTECRLRPCTALPVPAPAGDACCQVPVPCCIPLQCAAAIKQQQQCCLSPTLPRPSRSPGPTPHMPLSRSSTTKETPRPQHDEHPPPHTRPHSTPASSAGTVDMDAHQATQACCRCCCCSCYSGHSPSPLLAAAFTRIAPTGHNTLHAQDAAAAVHPSEPIHQTQTPPCCCCCLTQ